MKQLTIVKVTQGHRIPLRKDLCERLGVSIGDFVVMYETDRGEIAIAKPAIPEISADD